jgi:DNA-binding NarL/FixJ family response regulator
MTQSAFVSCYEEVVGTNRPRVLLGDDHALFSDKLRSLLAPHFDVVGAANDGEEVIAAARRLRPDVIVLDISMPVLNGLKAARRLKETGMRTKIVFCTTHADPTFVREAFDAGATGYVVKTAAASEIISAIRAALRDHPYVSPCILTCPRASRFQSKRFLARFQTSSVVDDL